MRTKNKKFVVGTSVALGALSLLAIAQFQRDRERIVADLVRNSQTVQVANGRIEYAVIGAGLPVLISHGTLGGYDQGLGIARLLHGHGLQRIAVSRAGYLRSSLTTGQTPAQQADSYAQLLDALNIPQAGIIGVSGGGPSALQFALRHPQRCRGLVLMSAITKAPPPLPAVMKAIVQAQDITMRFDFMWWLLFKLGLPGLMQMNGVDRVVVQQVNQDKEKMDIIRDLYRPLATSSLRLAGVRNDDNHITHLRPYPVEKISAPVLIIHSPTDPLAPFEQAAWLANAVPNGTLVEIKDGGHICFAVRKEQVNSQINNFF